MRQDPTTLRPPFMCIVGVLTTVTFPCWIFILVIDLLHLRPSTAAPLNYLSLGGMFWVISVVGAAPALFFRLKFLKDSMQFRWFG